ncbi:hypothetical protein ABQW55_015960 [Xanthomonas citri pv. malvacearum]|uniref:hypothetical protein n=1 Tax=Xanthomonas TaxID=338 RepID=UPI0012B67E39|nr:hypothetical protein [Xanthomonas citri]MCC4630289.1 hypothetical protein [Xanthomonas citri]WAW85900.1 hypothetical protein LPY96_16595 [Xanthomonas citri pv. malvacearum]
MRVVTGPGMRTLRPPPRYAHRPKRYGSDEAICLRAALERNTLNSEGTLKARRCIQGGAVWRHERRQQTHEWIGRMPDTRCIAMHQK